MSGDGLVTGVHVHPEDAREVLMLKKALASTLSGKVKVCLLRHKLGYLAREFRLYILTGPLQPENSYV